MSTSPLIPAAMQPPQPPKFGPGRGRPPATRTSAPIGPGLCDEQQTAAFLGLSVSFLREDRRGDRVIPFIRIGAKTVRYNIPDVMHALKAVTEGAAV